jgi:hypothetical protein
VALCLAAGSRAASAAIPAPSPLAKIGIDQINAVANSFEAWVRAVCPIFHDIVDSAYEISPELGDYYAELYSGVVCDVAEQDVAAVNAIAETFLKLVYTESDKYWIDLARDLAIARINGLKTRCVNAIWGTGGG